MIIESAATGVLLRIRVIPRAHRSAVAGTRDGALLVRLAAPPVEGAANDELIALLAGLLDIPKRQVAIVSGERSRLKKVRVQGVDAAQIARRLQTRTQEMDVDS